MLMRLLNRNEAVLQLESVGFEAQTLELVKRQLQRPHGIILVTGPTGSGKTTTLYSMLNELNQADKKIIAVEDPVEYQLERINQVQVNAKVGLSYANVLRSALRSDPVIIFVGEIRDSETADISLRVAMTGHLVLSSLHTNDAISSVVRLADMGVEDYLIASAVNLIISQRLVRRICESCRKPAQPDSSEKAWLESVGWTSETQAQFYHGTGCNHCNHSGYSGRVAVQAQTS